ncbi:MAG: dicarboxylate transporter, DctM subunit [Bacilli bacterium]|nr:dicarboxylate transporter, DctM subunit [Bacilli bacterium]
MELLKTLLYRFTRIITIALIFLMVLVIFLQVISRYVFNHSLPWSEELARYLFIWLALLGAALGIYKRTHPNIDIIVNYLSKSIQLQLHRAKCIISCSFFIVLFLHGYQATVSSWEANSAAMQISMGWPTLAIPTSALLMFLFTLAESSKLFNRPWLGVFITILLSYGLVELSSWLNLQNGVALIFILLILFLLIGIPVAISLGISSYWAIITTGAANLQILPQQMFGGLDSFALLAIPFFILAGGIMEKGGVAKRLVLFVSSLVSGFRGGLGTANIGASVLFADISGSAVADTAAIGSVMIPGMVEKGYHKPYVTALQAAAGSLGMLFPPSTSMIIFAMVAQISVAQLFLSSFVPGFLVAIGFAIVNYFVSKKRNYPIDKWKGPTEIIHAFKLAGFSLLAPIIILGGILGGIFTATEAGVVAIVYVLLVSIFAHRDLKWKDLFTILENSAVMTSRVTFVLAMAMIFGWFLTVNHVPQNITHYLSSISNNPIIILLLIQLFLMIIHTFMETGSTILIVVPIILPLLLQLGISPVLFGITVMLNSAIGLILPPMGIGLYTATSLTQVPLGQATREIIPFVMTTILVLLLVIIFPDLALGLSKIFNK